MFEPDVWEREDQETYRAPDEADAQTIREVDLVELRSGPIGKFVIAFLIGFIFLQRGNPGLQTGKESRTLC
ncbi:hypothetical protein JCM18237_28470 [Halorubrum luteum]